VRALTRVATPASEEGLLELAHALTASQLERALRAFRRLRAEEARASQELEYVDYHVAEDGSLYLRARLAAEDGTLVVKALEAARERVCARRREEERARGDAGAPGEACEPARSIQVEALVELARSVLGADGERACERARLVVHVDAAALADAGGRSELEGGPVVSAETARRLGCDAEAVAQLERDGVPLSVGRTRRTVPERLRRALEARDEGTCCWPGCERRRQLEAHHRVHWAHGGETSLDNLVLLCFHHHRLVHEGGYTVEDDPAGGLRFRNRHGVLCPSVPPRSPPGSAEALVRENVNRGLALDARTSRNGLGDPLDLELAVAAVERAVGALALG
jgi:5-methylcytosine-specific restriction endonuclease McrA